MCAFLNERAKACLPTSLVDFLSGRLAEQGRSHLVWADAHVSRLLVLASRKLVSDTYRRDISAVSSEARLGELLCEISLASSLGVISTMPPVLRPKTDRGTECDVKVSVVGHNLRRDEAPGGSVVGYVKVDQEVSQRIKAVRRHSAQIDGPLQQAGGRPQAIPAGLSQRFVPLPPLVRRGGEHPVTHHPSPLRRSNGLRCSAVAVSPGRWAILPLQLEGDIGVRTYSRRRRRRALRRQDMAKSEGAGRSPRSCFECPYTRRLTRQRSGPLALCNREARVSIERTGWSLPRPTAEVGPILEEHRRRSSGEIRWSADHEPHRAARTLPR